MEKDYGYVQDVTADLKTGTITSIIVPGNNKLINMFAGNNDIVIPWEQVKCIRRWYYISRNMICKKCHEKILKFFEKYIDFLLCDMLLYKSTKQQTKIYIV